MLVQIQLEEIIAKVQGKIALYYNFATDAKFILFLVTTTLIKYLDCPHVTTSNLFKDPVLPGLFKEQRCDLLKGVQNDLKTLHEWLGESKLC